MKNTLNSSGGAAGGWIEKLLWSQRRKLFEAFVQFRQGAGSDTVLEVGLSVSASAPCTNVPDNLQAWTGAEQKSLVTAQMIDPTNANLRLPFADNAFDWVFCSEVIEYAGTPQAQQALVSECYRVARKGLFVATPNRAHPIEFNSALPFVHLLPPAWHRRVLKWTGRERWSGLTMLDAPRLYALAAALSGAPAHDVGHKRVFGIKAHFFLMVRKETQQGAGNGYADSSGVESGVAGSLAA